MEELNATNKVRESSKFIQSNLQHVKIDFDKLDELTQWITEYKYDEFENSSNHPNKNELSLEQNLFFIFLVDSLNFCFWPHKMEYEDLTQFIRDNIKSGLFSLQYFMEISYENFHKKFIELFKEDKYNLMRQRYFNTKELCYYIHQQYDSKFMNLIKQNDFDCEKILNQIIGNLTSFQDHCVYQGRLVYFYKRAQILVGDLNEVLKVQFKSDDQDTKQQLEFFKQNQNLKNLQNLTCFADYRVPQVLHYFKILQYSEKLEKKIIENELIKSGSEEEVEIRGTMIYSIQYLQQKIEEKHQKKMLDIEIDWILWQYGEKQIKDTHPFHRTLGVFY